MSVITFERRTKRLEIIKGKQMKRSLITMLAAVVIGTTGYAVAQGHGGFHRGMGLEHLTQSLNLTPDQQTKVQPIIDQAKPQIMAIHRDAMQKTQAVMDNAMSQIRPLLTADQQKKADDLRKAHEDLHNAMKRLHDVRGE
jgi:Spy/CpxP family protein refolding chaperone